MGAVALPCGGTNFASSLRDDSELEKLKRAGMALITDLKHFAVAAVDLGSKLVNDALATTKSESTTKAKTTTKRSASMRRSSTVDSLRSKRVPSLRRGDAAAAEVLRRQPRLDVNPLVASAEVRLRWRANGNSV